MHLKPSFPSGTIRKLAVPLPKKLFKKSITSLHSGLFFSLWLNFSCVLETDSCWSSNFSEWANGTTFWLIVQCLQHAERIHQSQTSGGCPYARRHMPNSTVPTTTLMADRSNGPFASWLVEFLAVWTWHGTMWTELVLKTLRNYVRKKALYIEHRSSSLFLN